MRPPPQTIAWDQRLATGFADVDAQHQELFRIVNRLGILHAEGASLEAWRSLIDALHQYTVHHFRSEESLMDSHPVSEGHRMAHLKAHRWFVEHVRRAGVIAADDPDGAPGVMLAFLAQWLLHHVASTDLQLAEEIRRSGVDGAPQDATGRYAAGDYLLTENINRIYRDLGDRTFDLLELNLKLRSEIARRQQIEEELNESKARFRTMADHTHSWEYWQGADGNIIYMSPSCERVTGYRPDEFLADPDLLYRIIYPDDQPLMADHRDDIRIEEADEEELGFRIVHRDGDVRWIMHGCKALYNADGDFIGRRGSNRDITDRHTQTDGLLLVANVLESVNDAVLVTDEENRVMVVNSAFTRITGYEPEELIGQNPGMLADEVPSPEVVRVQWETLTATGCWRGEMINRRKNGELYVARVSIEAVRDDSGGVSNFVLVFSDVTELKEKDRRIHHLAHHDPLTGLPNWTLLNERMDAAIEAASLEGRRVGLMFVDVDRFKQAKDKLGHVLGDALIKELAARMMKRLRAGDMAARIGSDEFAVLLPDIEAEREAGAVADALLAAMTEPFKLDEHTVRISVSIGLAFYPDHGDSVGTIMKHADLAMYQTKQGGGGAACIYNSADWK